MGQELGWGGVDAGQGAGAGVGLEEGCSSDPPWKSSTPKGSVLIA